MIPGWGTKISRVAGQLSLRTTRKSPRAKTKTQCNQKKKESLGPVLETYQFSSGQSLSHVRLFATIWTAACQACLSITNSQSLPKLMSIESVTPSNHLILCLPLIPPSIFPSIRVYSSESVLPIRWPKYWSFSFSISPSNEHSGLISFRMDWLDLLAVKGLSTAFSNSTESKQVCGNGSLPSPLPPPPRA